MTTTAKTTTTTRIPTPVYAAAGAGDLAYQQLRRLPEQVAQLRDRVNELRPQVTEAVSETNLRVDLDRLRTVARRNAAAFVAGAQVAQERAVAVYTELVTRGEKVVGGPKAAQVRIALDPAADAVKTEVKTSEPTPAKKTTTAKKATASRS